MCQCVSTAPPWRVYGACTAFALSVLFPFRSHRDHCAPAALPRRSRGAPAALLRRSHYVHRRLQCVCSAFAERRNSDAFALGVNPTKWYKSGLVLTTPIVCSSFADLIRAVERQQPGLLLAYMHVQLVQDDSNVVHLIQRRMRRRAPRRRKVCVRQWLDVYRRLQHGH